ncbi:MULTISPECIES: hypothetical protein [Moorena]|uniref:Uncharacterized protein n=1 Tax=Moorena producens 3L TaxID=489825 RepID=F4XVB0_9CYAN|nr:MULTISPECIES: hypothetical protein [Moorena]NEP52407.1 hypothetical protein [Moorena sp. SIO3C2]EGJ31458.1 hypothetical protein LYNGBM3L_38960 [Moorena producens 3L]NEP37199.1 hypothetical protein [Moorena sp. SIO3B2]NEQ06342.1 hypothetical protein [Moorena sp. SIO4E2]NER88438.1 hypothetical protein [Moorena sp. SIO3A2]
MFNLKPQSLELASTLGCDSLSNVASRTGLVWSTTGSLARRLIGGLESQSGLLTNSFAKKSQV